MKNDAYCCRVLIKKPYKTQYPALPLGQKLGALCRGAGAPLGSAHPDGYMDAAALKQQWAKHARGNTPCVFIQ